MNPPKVSIIVLNWNRWKDTVECLESLFQISYPNYEVLVIDNGSQDDSPTRLKEYCDGNLEVESKYFKYSRINKPIHILEYSRMSALFGNLADEESFSKLASNKKLKLILNERNYGFAEGNNVGIVHCMRGSVPDYVLMLNNDTAVDRSFLDELVRASDQESLIGFAGPKIYYYDSERIGNVISWAGGRTILWKGESSHVGKDEIDEGQHDEQMEVDYVAGTCILVKTKAIAEIGPLDSTFFAYWEEDDWCARGHRVGYKSVYVPRAMIWHKISRSDLGKTRTYFMTRNRFWFVRKHATHSQYILFLAYFFSMNFFPRIAVFAFGHRDINMIKIFLKGIYHGIRPSEVAQSY